MIEEVCECDNKDGTCVFGKVYKHEKEKLVLISYCECKCHD